MGQINSMIYNIDVVRSRQLQDAVQTAHETSDQFSDETLREQKVFQRAKEAEMKEMLGSYADGQIEFYRAVRNVLPGK